MIGGRILHGGDYNPEQWLESPEVFEEDLKLMKEAAVNCVTVGVFSWAVLEPQEGIYNFGWLEHIMKRLEEEEIQVILATPSGAMPHWLTQKYPEVCQVGADGVRNRPGKRHNFCYTSPIMRSRIQAMNRELSKRFGKNKNLLLWHISNELGSNFGDCTCHCELCEEAFRGWLKKKYKTLDNLNFSWWNRFWSHVYSDWSQIQSPMNHGETTCTPLLVDWMRFSTEQMGEYSRGEIEALREYSDAPTTTNFMYYFKGMDYQKLNQNFDVVSWDNYPFWHKQKDEVPVAVKASMNHSMMRSFKKKPFLLMESSPSAVNWRDINPLRRPGVHMLSSMQSVAHGSDSVLYFQWRKSRGSQEKFHGAVIDHRRGTNTRVFREVAELGKRLEGLSPLVNGTINKPRIAVICDWENWWAIEDTDGPRKDINYIKTVTAHYQALWEAGVEADFISMDDSLEGYKLVIAPLNYMYKEGYPERVREYVKQGGRYVTTYFSGLVNDTDLCFINELPLEDVLGVIEEEIDAPMDEFKNHFAYKGNSYPAEFLCDLVQPFEDTKVISVYENDFYKGYPVLTEHAYGNGKAYYLAAQSDRDFYNAFYQDLLKECGIENPLHCPLPYGVTTTEREGNGHRLVFVMNVQAESAVLENIGIWKDADTGAVYDGVLELPGFSCKVLTEAGFANGVLNSYKML